MKTLDLPHKLVIDSLRDLKARCSCGRWTIVSPAFDDETDNYLRDKATEEHARHQERASRDKTCPHKPGPVYARVEEQLDKDRYQVRVESECVYCGAVGLIALNNVRIGEIEWRKKTPSLF
jgi:hypothetical protein